ncbi:MAG: GcrA family cell cycle regulator [Roseibium sp.]
MSLAEIFFPTLWADLTPDKKRDAVLAQLSAGRTASEAAELLSGIYGPIGTNHVRGVMNRHQLHDAPDVKAAVAARRQMERAAVRARARGAGSNVVKLPPAARLPRVPLPDMGRTGNRPGSRTGKRPEKRAEKRLAQRSGLTLFELRENTCKRPLWDDPDTAFADKFFCGRPSREGTSFCAGCAKEIYRAPGEDR